jgi:hypothetical protein
MMTHPDNGKFLSLAIADLAEACFSSYRDRTFGAPRATCERSRPLPIPAAQKIRSPKPRREDHPVPGRITRSSSALSACASGLSTEMARRDAPVSNGPPTAAAAGRPAPATTAVGPTEHSDSAISGIASGSGRLPPRSANDNVCGAAAWMGGAAERGRATIREWT